MKTLMRIIALIPLFLFSNLGLAQESGPTKTELKDYLNQLVQMDEKGNSDQDKEMTWMTEMMEVYSSDNVTKEDLDWFFAKVIPFFELRLLVIKAQAPNIAANDYAQGLEEMRERFDTFKKMFDRLARIQHLLDQINNMVDGMVAGQLENDEQHSNLPRNSKSPFEDIRPGDPQVNSARGM